MRHPRRPAFRPSLPPRRAALAPLPPPSDHPVARESVGGLSFCWLRRALQESTRHGLGRDCFSQVFGVPWGTPAPPPRPPGGHHVQEVGGPSLTLHTRFTTARSSSRRQKHLRGEGPAAAPRGGAGMELERYTVVRKIGEGTYGAAYLVHLRDDPGHALVMYALAPPRARGVAGGGGARSPQQHQQPGEAAKAPEPGRGGGSRSGGRSWPAAPPPALPPVVDVPPRRREVTSLGPVLVRSCVLLDPGDTTLRGTAAGPGHRHRGHRRAGSPDRALASEEAGCPGG